MKFERNYLWVILWQLLRPLCNQHFFFFKLDICLMSITDSS